MKALVDKSFRFVDVWSMYTKRNMTGYAYMCLKHIRKLIFIDVAIFKRTAAGMNEEEDDLENDGNNVSDGEEQEEV